MLDGQREKSDTHRNGNMLHTEAVVTPMPGKLTDTALRGAKPREKACKLTDGGGLCLEVAPMRPSIR